MHIMKPDIHWDNYQAYVSFDCLNPGDMFVFDDELYQKTTAIGAAIRISTGEVVKLSITNNVIPVNVDIHVGRVNVT